MLGIEVQCGDSDSLDYDAVSAEWFLTFRN